MSDQRSCFGKTLLPAHAVLAIGCFLVAAASIGSFGQASLATSPALASQDALADPAVDTVRAALVHIRIWLPSEAQPHSGTGFVIARRAGHAYILTADHVVHPEKKQVVRIAFQGGGIVPAIEQDGQAQPFEVASDPNADLALLRVPAPDSGPIAPLGHPQSEVKRLYGATILGFGQPNPGGPLPAISVATGTLTDQTRSNRSVLVSNAPITVGMSGGPVIGGSGRVIGVALKRDSTTTGMPETTVAMVTDLSSKIESDAGIKITRQRPEREVPEPPEPPLDRPEEASIKEAMTQAGHRHFVLLVGTGGTGKTVLAAKMAKRLYNEGRYPDGVYWIGVAEQSPEWVIASLANLVLGDRQSNSVPDLVNELSRNLTRQSLVVLDDLREDLLSPLLLKALAGTDLLVTSRRSYSHEAISAIIPIGQLSPSLSRTLLRGTLKKTADYPIALVQDADLDALANRLGHLPLALRLAATAMVKAKSSVAELMSELQSQLRPVLDLTPDARDRNDSVRAVLSWWWDHLQPNEREVLTAMGQLGDSIMPTELVLAAHGSADGAAALEQLTLWSIIDRVYGQPEIKMHTLVHEWAKETGAAKLPAVAAEAQKRMGTWLAKKSYELNRIKEWKPYWSGHIEQAMSHARRNRDSDLSYQLADKWNYLLSRHDTVLQAKLWQWAVDGLAQSQDQNQRCEAASELAAILEQNGIHEAAFAQWESCIQAARQGATRHLAYCLASGGSLATEIGKFTVAETYLKEAQRIYAAEKQPSILSIKSLASVYHNLSVIEFRLGHPLKVKEYTDLEEATQRRISTYGKTNNDDEKFNPAKSCSDNALIAEKKKDAVDFLHTLSLCTAQEDKSRDAEYVARTIELLKLCVKYAQESKINKYESLCAHNLAVAALDHRDSPMAIKYGLLCINSYSEVTDINGMADCFEIIGAANNNSKQFTAAYYYYKEALAYRRKLENKHKLMDTLRDMVLVARNSQDWCVAIKHYTELIELSKKYDPVNTAAYEHNQSVARQRSDPRLCALIAITEASEKQPPPSNPAKAVPQPTKKPVSEPVPTPAPQ